MLLFNQLQTYLYLALVLFVIGLYGVLARRSLIAILISVELILNAASINFMAFNRFLAPHPAVGQRTEPGDPAQGAGDGHHLDDLSLERVVPARYPHLGRRRKTVVLSL